MFDIDELWAAPFKIPKTAKVATYGSCFAQHFSRALVARGFAWMDAEPAPEGMTPQNAKRFNYGVFSARTANIYTTSLFLQWTEWALGESQPPEIYWEHEGRIIDPFRPTIEPDGFASVDEMYASRAACIAAFRTSIMESNVLVFTLGLTESWWDAAGGFEYPMCPGTSGGTFDPEKHVFKNQKYGFVRKKLIKAIRLIRKARDKGPRILLTVSPVPLVATNSGNHVLVATMESKSILRAVAGNVANSIKNVSYFPSYEIINAAPYRGSFFEPNMRGVNPNGVNHVMKTFFAGLTSKSGVSDAGQGASAGGDPAGGTHKKPASGQKKAKGQKRSRKTAQGEPRLSAAQSDELVCEEELLAAFGPDK